MQKELKPPPPGQLPESLSAAGLEHAPDAILCAHPRGMILYANPAASLLLGHAREAFPGLALAALLPDLRLDTWEAPSRETILLAKDGTRIPVELTLAWVPPSSRTLVFMFIKDLTARRAAEAALKKSESRFALAFNASPDAINITRLDDGTYLEVSQGFERMSGWKREEAVGRTAPELDLWHDKEDRARMTALLKEHGEFDGQLFTFRRKDGTLLKGMMSGRMVSLDGVPCLLTITRDVTLQLDAQQALGNLTDLISAITASVPAFILLLDREGRVLFINRLPRGHRLEDVIGMDFRDSLSAEARPEASAAMARILEGSERETFDGLGWGDAGELRWYHTTLGPMTESGKLVGIVLIAMDDTERRRQEERLRDVEEALRQSQKLESLGVLAGGIAHDFNNLLTAIMGNLNLAQLKLPEQSPAHPHLESVENTVLKASELTRQMLAYSGKGRFSVKPHNLNVVVEEMVHLLKVTVTKKAHLTVQLGAGLPAIEGDASQLQQVIMNLVTNASEALGDREGVIRVATGLEVLDQERILAAFPAQALDPGPYVVLEVEDTGCGMAPEVLARIFEPFFTTKVQGRGLGLSAMLGILKGHRAGISIRSRAGAGTSFQIYFPASLEPVPARPGPGAQAPGGFTGKVLLVDDEVIILESIGVALRGMAFEVLEARDGLEAVEQFEASGGDLTLVMMDLTMPRMDGATAFKRMQALHPGIPVILSSGYDRQALDGVRPAAFVQKPYRLSQLRKLLQEVLG